MDWLNTPEGKAMNKRMLEAKQRQIERGDDMFPPECVDLEGAVMIFSVGAIVIISVVMWLFGS